MERISIGETVTILAREVSEEMLNKRHEWRMGLGLPPEETEPASGALSQILRVYTRPPDQGFVETELALDGSWVKVTGMAQGVAWVDIIDEASEPEGTQGFTGGHMFVVLPPRLPARAPTIAPLPRLDSPASETAPEHTPTPEGAL